MPRALEETLKRRAAKKNWPQERKNAYVYGTLRKTGGKPSTQKKKGKNYSKEAVSLAMAKRKRG